MKKHSNKLTPIAAYLESFDIVIALSISFVLFQVFETTSFFYKILIIELKEFRVIASILISLVVEWMQIVFSLHKTKVKLLKNISLPIAIVSLIINLLYFECWIGEIDVKIIKWFISILVAGISYILAELLIFKYLEEQTIDFLNTYEKELTTKEKGLTYLNLLLSIKEQKLNNQELSQNKKETGLKKAQQNVQNAEQELNKIHQAINKAEQELNKVYQKTNKLKAKILADEEDRRKRTCKYCPREFGTVLGKNSHEGKCEHNPKNKQPKKLLQTKKS